MYKILIVEDNKMDRNLLRSILMKMDEQFDIRDVSSVRAAMDEMKNQTPDLILLDIYMPDKDGFSFLQELSKNGHEDIPVFLVSVFTEKEDKLKGFQLGATDFINKPIVAEELKARVAVQYRLKKIQEDRKWEAKKTNDGIKLLYKELEIKNKKLEQLDLLKDEFVSNVSHELRTPLTIIRESISQMGDGLFGIVNERQNKYLNKSLTNIDRLRKIIDDLLDISKIENGKLEIYRVNVNMVELTHELAANFSIKAENKGIKINVKNDKERIEIFADKEKIIQVLTNLVGNACKFTDKGCIEISVVENATHVQCSVQDTGIGIASEDLPQLFTKFYQIGRIAGPGEKGTGLGLAITKGIIELHDGLINMESIQGKGTKITFVLPKYSSIDERRISLSRWFKSHMRQYDCFSVLYFGFKSFDGKTDEILRPLETFIKNNLYRQSDITMMGIDAVYVILPDTVNEDGRAVLNRISKIIMEKALPDFKNDPQNFHFNVVTYPKDGLIEEELMAKLSDKTED